MNIDDMAVASVATYKGGSRRWQYSIQTTA